MPKAAGYRLYLLNVSSSQPRLVEQLTLGIVLNTLLKTRLILLFIVTGFKLITVSIYLIDNKLKGFSK